MKVRARLCLFLIIATSIVALFAISCGAVKISLSEMLSAIGKVFNGDEGLSMNERIFLYLRLPRVLLCVLVGGTLAAGGTLMQSLFRNPIVEPGLVGTSSGAAFGAALYFVLGASFSSWLMEWTLPLAAVSGAILSTFLVFLLSPGGQNRNRTVALLLTGIAINALFLSGVGFLAYIARDPQARSITFWGLGSIGGASWKTVLIVCISTGLCMLAAFRFARQLNALMLGEEEARLLGVDTSRLRFRVLGVNMVMTAVATAFVGVISFVGLIVPHLLRLRYGSDNRMLIPASFLLGGILLNLADLIARTIVVPAELPIGIVTSFVGVPVFILLLRSKRNYL